ncbi:tetratricopeptide repeat protein [Coleofasciculus sp. FACHB-SPT36]|uniref:CHAT domain-containing protein n=1 Tax=Cyanophyceae TaxID=3028117 RepID=UPI00168B7F63|nr:tetratricopeptide repeat protein [Coleofasciculus sp. FACHB-SPT36]MBD2539852.1 tetratricopeptide repeat protein [Coleofasciculus sp. FACHB-SPT36]
MRPPVQKLSFTTALLLSFGCFSPVAANSLALPGFLAEPAKKMRFIASRQEQKTEADRLFQLGIQQFRNSQFKEALQTLERVLEIRKRIGDKPGVGEALTSLGEVYNGLSQYAKALESLQQALSFRKEARDKVGEGRTLTEIGATYRELGQFPKVMEILQQALGILKTTDDKVGKGNTLYNIGIVYSGQGQYPQALEFLQQALETAKAADDKLGEGRTLNTIGGVYDSQGQYQKAIEFQQQALKILRDIGDRLGEVRTLNNLGITYRKLGRYPQALEVHQQALAISRDIGNPANEGRNLYNIGVVYRSLGNYPQALEYYQQALAISQEIGDKTGEGRTLIGIGAVYDSLGQYPKALESYQQASRILKTIGDKAGVGATLNNIGGVYYSMGEYSQALELYQQALEIARTIGDKAGEGRTLSNMGGVYDSLGQYPQALEFYQQALANRRTIGNRAGEGNTLNSIGGVYENLGQYSQALAFFKQALEIRREIGDKAGEGTTLNNLGETYRNLGQYPEALKLYQQAVEILKEIGDKAGEGVTLNNIGVVSNQLGQYPQALEFFQQALAIRQTVGDRAGVGATLNNIGGVYNQLEQYPQALEFFQQALGIAREIGDKTGERIALGNMGFLLEKQNQPELAIAFYKQAVNVTEVIRQDLRVLPREQQESYTQTIADTYRAFTNLLLSQGRILEAQQVLELLKIQELPNYTKNARAGDKTSGIALNPIEEKILKENGTLIAFGQQVEQCKQNRCSQLSQFNDRLQALTEQYNQTIETIQKEIRSRRAQDDAFFDPNKLSKAKEIVESQPGTVLIYPFVLKDKIWLLWASKGGIVKSLEVPVTQRQLGESVLKFRQLVEDSRSDIAEVKATGKQLYDWLIKPIEPELKGNKIQNLVFSMDRVTRYIPISALFDGEKYLIENYSVSTVLSADLTDVRDRLPPGIQNTSVLALGLSHAVAGFNSLPNVPAELDAIVQKKPNDTTGIYPGNEFLNNAFDFPTLRDNLTGHQILHIATHGQFVPGRPDDSFLLLGTGEKLTISQIQTLQDLGNVHLVVLSACETALGGPDQDGVEIAGISYYFLNAGTKAVIASLWLVDDRSTSQLMQKFYSYLAQSTQQTPITKATALRQSQLGLLHSDFSTPAPNNVDSRGSINVEAIPNSRSKNPLGAESKFDHPYYWAPFILIGNGL